MAVLDIQRTRHFVAVYICFAKKTHYFYKSLMKSDNKVSYIKLYYKELHMTVFTKWKEKCLYFLDTDRKKYNL